MKARVSQITHHQDGLTVADVQVELSKKEIKTLSMHRNILDKTKEQLEKRAIKEIINELMGL